jgi:hypothetical protein
MIQTMPISWVNELQEWTLLLHPARRSFQDITADWDAMITRQTAERVPKDREAAA